MWRVSALDAIKRDPGRYVSELPDGVEPGPYVGLARVILN